MNVEIITHGDNYIYLIMEGSSAVVVDPSSAEPVLSALKRFDVELSLILITHHHSDHTGGCRKLKSVTGCAVSGMKGSSIPGLDRPLLDGDVIEWGEVTFQAFAVPGHTADHLAYYSADQKLLFTGDALFACSCGRLFEGTAEQMWSSFEKLRALPDDVLVYYGHEYTADNIEFALTVDPDNRALQQRAEDVRKLLSKGQPSVPSILGIEKATNPFFRTDTLAIRQFAGLADAKPSEVFAEIRRRKDRA